MNNFKRNDYFDQKTARLLVALLITILATSIIFISIVLAVISYSNKKVEETEIPSKYTEEDVRLLAQLIYGEAGGEPYEGQVAVGAVVMNRVESASFPNTIEGVIYQKRQFSCVDDGNFYKEIPEYSTVYQAAREALNGVDPTNGCIYFYNPNTSTSRWIFENTTTVVTIGNHRFAVGK